MMTRNMEVEVSNPGLDFATKAARAIGAKVVIPELGKKADAWNVWNEKSEEGIRNMVENAFYPTPREPSLESPKGDIAFDLEAEPNVIQQIRSALSAIPANAKIVKYTPDEIIGWGLTHVDRGIPAQVAAEICSEWDKRTGGNSRRVFNSSDPNYNLTKPVTIASIFALARKYGWNSEESRQENLDAGWFASSLSSGSVERFIDNAPPTLKWVFKDTLLARTTGMLVGPGAVGKSTLTLLMLMAVATGRDILHGIFTPAIVGKVLGVFSEDDEAILHHRIYSLVNQLFSQDQEAKDLLRENMKVITATGHDVRFLDASIKPIRQSNFFNEVFHAIGQIEDLQLIVLDPVSRLHGGEENDNGAGTFLITLLEQIAQKTGAAVIVIHHVSKKAGLDNSGFNLEAAMHQDAARGASGLTNGVRWQCNLLGLPEKFAKKVIGDTQASPGQYLAIKVSKKNYGPPEETHFLERIKGGLLMPAKQVYRDIAPDLDDLIKGLILDAVLKVEGKNLTKRMLIDGNHRGWKKADSRVTRTIVDQTIAACVLHEDLFERQGKNASGKIITYLSRHPEPSTNLESEIIFRTGDEPEAFEPENPEGTGKSNPTGHNSSDLKDKVVPEETNRKKDAQQIISHRNYETVEPENYSPYGEGITPSGLHPGDIPLPPEEDENAEWF
jgi:regulatory protein RepA